MSCFSKDKRLLKKHQFDYVFKKAKRVYCSEFLILFRANKQLNARLGLTVSKKSLAKAVSRNCCKRLVRESFRRASLPNVDIIFLSRKGLELLSNEQLSQKLAVAWAKLNVIHSEIKQ